jgi:hypothetical protein
MFKVQFCLLFLGCEHTNLWADEYWECMARHYTVTIYHPAGIYNINIREAYLTLADCHSMWNTFIDSRIFGPTGIFPVATDRSFGLTGIFPVAIAS